MKLQVVSVLLIIVATVCVEAGFTHRHKINRLNAKIKQKLADRRTDESTNTSKQPLERMNAHKWDKAPLVDDDDEEDD